MRLLIFTSLYVSIFFNSPLVICRLGAGLEYHAEFDVRTKLVDVIQIVFVFFLQLGAGTFRCQTKMNRSSGLGDY